MISQFPSVDHPPQGYFSATNHMARINKSSSIASRAMKLLPIIIPLQLLLIVASAASKAADAGVTPSGTTSLSTIGAGNMTCSAKSENPFIDWVDMETILYEERVSAADNWEEGGLDADLEAAERIRTIIGVSQDGSSGQFRTVTDAINSIPSGNKGRVVIRIGPGTYNEKIWIDANKPFITFYGTSETWMPTIVFGGTARKFGTFYSATVCVMSNYFMAVNVIFKNSAPKPAPGSQGGQAVALRIAGDKASFFNCHFLGFQDTLHDDTGHHYYKNCLIQGNVDFIFGDARSLYTGCSIVSVADPIGLTAIIAQGRSTGNDIGGFSFVHCNVTGSGSAHLSRAWRSFSRVVFAYSFLGKVVDPSGWDNRGLSKQNLYYGEYHCYGPGADRSRRVEYCTQLSDAQARGFLNLPFINGRTWILPPPTVG